MICKFCNNQIEDGIAFCPRCGNKLPAASSSNPETEQLKIALQQANATIYELNRQSTQKKPAATVFIILAAVFLVGCIGLGIAFAIADGKYVSAQNNADDLISQVSDLENSKSESEKQISDLQSSTDGYKKQISDLQSSVDGYKSQVTGMQNTINEIMPGGMLVKVTSIYNGDDGMKKISDELSAKTLQYLMFDFTVYASDGFSNYSGKELQIKVLDPAGYWLSGTNSPTDCTLTHTITDGNNTEGWGSATGGAYTTGLYDIEFFYDGSFVGELAVYISE